MKSVLYIIRRGRTAPEETADLMLISGAFEQRTSVLFLDDGVYQLHGAERRQSRLRALKSYDVEDIHVHEASLAERALTVADLDLDAKAATDEQVRELIACHDIVLTD